MAGYECSLCNGDEQATLLITPLTGGETMAVGQGCMGVAFAGMLAGHLGVDADKLYDAAARLAKRATEAKPVAQSANGGAPPAAPPKRPRGRPRKATQPKTVSVSSDPVQAALSREDAKFLGGDDK